MENNTNLHLTTETIFFSYLNKLLLITSESECPLDVKNRIRYEVLSCFELHGLAHVNIKGELIASAEIRNVIYNLFHYLNLGHYFDEYPSLTNTQNTLKGKECLNSFLATLIQFSDIARKFHSDRPYLNRNESVIPLVGFQEIFPEIEITPTDMLVKNCYIRSFPSVESPNQEKHQFTNLTELSSKELFDYIQLEYNTFYIISNLVDKIALNYKASKPKLTCSDYAKPTHQDNNVSEIFNGDDNDLNHRLYEEEKKSKNNESVIITIAVLCAPIFLGGVYNQNIFFALLGIALGAFI
ncbi:hypothetical protein OND84_004289, partial [Morganella morganii]|nr:hypothetical protein [Morganella morganii]